MYLSYLHRAQIDFLKVAVIPRDPFDIGMKGFMNHIKILFSTKFVHSGVFDNN